MASIKLSDLDTNDLVLVIAPSEKVATINLSILEHVLKKKNNLCVYVTISKPANIIKKNLEKKNIPTKGMFFIDCITPVGSVGEMQRIDNVIYSQPQSLTNISIAMTQAIQSIPKANGKILIFDTLSTLILYNEKERVARFMHALSAKMRQWEVKSIIFTLEEETDKTIISEVGSFCDKIIRVK